MNLKKKKAKSKSKKHYKKKKDSSRLTLTTLQICLPMVYPSELVPGKRYSLVSNERMATYQVATSKEEVLSMGLQPNVATTRVLLPNVEFVETTFCHADKEWRQIFRMSLPSEDDLFFGVGGLSSPDEGMIIGNPAWIIYPEVSFSDCYDAFPVHSTDSFIEEAKSWQVGDVFQAYHQDGSPLTLLTTTDMLGDDCEGKIMAETANGYHLVAMAANHAFLGDSKVTAIHETDQGVLWAKVVPVVDVTTGDFSTEKKASCPDYDPSNAVWLSLASLGPLLGWIRGIIPSFLGTPSGAVASDYPEWVTEFNGSNLGEMLEGAGAAMDDPNDPLGRLLKALLESEDEE